MAASAMANSGRDASSFWPGQRAAPACPGADDVGGTTTGKLCRNGADEKGQYVVSQLPEEKETSLPSDAVPE
jgi:hypothetical protein